MLRQRMRSRVAVADRVTQLVDRSGAGAQQGKCTYRGGSAPHRAGILGGRVLFRRVQARALVALTALLLALPAAAWANGDPASDVLLQSKVYFPTQRVSVEEATKLKAIVDKANAKGYPIKVALIHDETDLGTVPSLLNQAQKYSEFLGPEIRFAYRGDLLVVMPTGLGLTTTDQTEPPAKAIEGMKVDAGGSPDGLALTAEEAVTKLAAAAGHPIAAKSKGGGGGGAVGIVIAVVVVLIGLLVALMVRRGQATSDAEAPAP